MTALTGWRTKSFMKKAKVAAECSYLLYIGLSKTDRPEHWALANTCFEGAQQFAALATVPDFLGGEQQWGDLVDRFLEGLEGKLKDAEHMIEKKRQIEEYTNAHSI